MVLPINDKPLLYDLSNFTIMIVEDSPYMQSLMSSMLKVFDVGDIITCESAEEAVEVLTITQLKTKSRFITKVDIILTDWLMPKGSGADLLTWVRTNDKDSVRFLPVVVISGFTTEIITSETRDLGANELLVKPISANTLAARICTVIDHPRPFVECPTFFGPDRRRRDMVMPGIDRRVTKPKTVEIKR